MQTILQKLKRPPKEFSPTFFWSWNDRLEEQELIRQIHEMEKQRIGGFFIHARPGLITEYLSEEWIRLVRKSVKECENREIQPWLYDEHGWPSGIGGGSVPARGREYQEKCLKIREMICEEACEQENLLGIYVLRNGRCERLRTIPADMLSVIAVSYVLIPDYVDLLSKDVVRAFIDDSYERYKDSAGEWFGSLIPGIFTDEPQFNSQDHPWSFVLPRAYFEKYGEDILDMLPGLKYDFDGADVFRYRYYSTVNELFVNSYFKQIGEWCRENGLILTGHNMAEDSLYDSMLFNAGVMPSYEYMQMPGTDWIGRTIRETLTPRQCSSVAAQLGKPRVLTEQFASCNWDVPFEELKWIVDWNFVNGVNFFCQHLAAYSLRGLRKRDCPASLFDHNVWWEKYHILTDYMARISMLLSNGHEVCDVAVLHPIKSAYLFFKRENRGEMLRLDNEFLGVLDYLSHIHIPYHLADEEILKNHGSARDGRLQIGCHFYQVLILPRLHSLERNTYDLLLRFAESGGQIYSFGRLPDRIDGCPADLSELNQYIADCSELPSYVKILDCVNRKNADGNVTPSDIGVEETERSFSNGVFTARYSNFWEKTTQGILPRTTLDMPEAKYVDIDRKTEAFLCELDNAGVSRIRVTCEGKQVSNIHCFRTVNDGMEICFLANHDKYNRYKTRIEFDSGCSFAGYDPFSNSLYELNASYGNGKISFDHSFAPMESLILLQTQEPGEEKSEPKKALYLGEEFQVTDYGFNALTLDYCSYRTAEDNTWSEPTPVWDVHYRLLKARQDTILSMRFRFEISPCFQFNQPLQIGAEDVDQFKEILLNGTDISNRFQRSLVERAIRVADIADLAVHGDNELLIKKQYCFDESAYLTLFGGKEHMASLDKITLPGETDAVYVFGRFAVYSKSSLEDVPRDGAVTDGPFFIDNENLSLCGLDLIRQGYLFYNQAICVEQTIDVPHTEGRIILSLKQLRAPCVEVFVNGKSAATLAFHPLEADITSFVLPGKNTVTLKIYTSNRNLFGNFHYKLGQVHWSNWYKQIHPKEWLFCDEKKSWFTNRYCFYRNGVDLYNKDDIEHEKT